MKGIERLTAAEIQLRSPPVVTAAARNFSLQYGKLRVLQRAVHFLGLLPDRSAFSSLLFTVRLCSNPLSSTQLHQLCCTAQPHHTFTPLLPIIEFP
jgi:hypothetical protein